MRGSFLPPIWIFTRLYGYGFQGQEMDDEVKGKGNSANYKYRMHDPRIGRFFAVDPLTSEYPHYTPYSFSGNKVIHAIELEGLEEYIVLYIYSKVSTEPTVSLIKWSDLYPDETHGPLGNGSAYYSNFYKLDFVFGEEWVDCLGDIAFDYYAEDGSDSDFDVKLNKTKTKLETARKTLTKTRKITDVVVDEVGSKLSKVTYAVGRKGAKYLIVGIEVMEALQKEDYGGAAEELLKVIPIVDDIITIIEDGKDPNGLTNLSNGRLADAYSSNKRAIDESYHQAQARKREEEAKAWAAEKAKKEKLGDLKLKLNEEFGDPARKPTP